MPAADVAVAYKQLWTVEDIFRSMKSLLETRPVYHRTDAAIRGHVFCSFLALRLRWELEARLAARGESFEWASIVRDLDRVEETEVEQQGTPFLLRTDTPGSAGKVLPGRRLRPAPDSPTGELTPEIDTSIPKSWCQGQNARR